jgi:hypothetical protein
MKLVLFFPANEIAGRIQVETTPRGTSMTLELVGDPPLPEVLRLETIINSITRSRVHATIEKS